MNKSGIYKITNIIDNKFYIGSAKNIIKRWVSHKVCLKKNKHHSLRFQNAWNKYGEESFILEVLVNGLIEEELLIVEQYFLDNLKPYDPKIGYNICSVANKPPSWRGRQHSLETKNKMTNNSIGINNPFFGHSHSKETKEKISLMLKKSYENGERISPMKGRKCSEEHKYKLSIKMRGEGTPCAKLTWEIVEIIRTEREKGVTQQSLADRFGVTKTTIRYIEQHKTWKLINDL